MSARGGSTPVHSFKPKFTGPSNHLEMDYAHLQIDHKMSYVSAYLKAGWLDVWALGLAIHDSLRISTIARTPNIRCLSRKGICRNIRAFFQTKNVCFFAVFFIWGLPLVALINTSHWFETSKTNHLFDCFVSLLLGLFVLCKIWRGVYHSRHQAFRRETPENRTCHL